MELKDLIFIATMFFIGTQIFYGFPLGKPFGNLLNLSSTGNQATDNTDLTNCQQQIAQMQEQIDSLQRDKQSLEAQTCSFSTWDFFVGIIFGCIASLFIYWEANKYLREKGTDAKAEAHSFIRRFVEVERTKKQLTNARKIHRKRKA